jgi:histidinol-phosphate aminotransferase
MSVYWNDRVRGLEPYVPGEQPRDRRYIKLNTNENPYPPSPATLEAIRAAASGDLRLYSDPVALDLRRAIGKRYGVGEEMVFVGNGSDEILAFAFGAFFGPGEGRAADGRGAAAPVLFPDISYSFYPVYAQLWGLGYRQVPLADGFELKADDYLVPSGGVVFPNPNAPTGRAIPLSEVLRVVDFQAESNRVVLVDEAYVDFGAESAVGATASRPNLLTVHTLSKSRSLAGLRVGFAIGQAELIEGLRRVKDSFNSYTLDRCALAGAAAAMADSAYYDEVNARVAATRDRTAAALAALGFAMPPSRANFLFVRHPRLAGAVLFKALRERGILVRHWNKGRIADHLRVSIGTDAEMDAFLAACAAILEETP